MVTEIRSGSRNTWPEPSSVTAGPGDDVFVSGHYAGRILLMDGTLFGQGGAPYNVSRGRLRVADSWSDRRVALGLAPAERKHSQRD